VKTRGANSDVHELERPLRPHSSGLPQTVSLGDSGLRASGLKRHGSPNLKLDGLIQR